MRRFLIPFILLFTVSIISCSTGDDTKMYDVTVSTSPSSGGTVSPSDTTVEEGTELSLQSNPSDKHLFTHWNGDIDSTSGNPYSLTVDQDYNITANFELKSYELTINKEGEGTVNEEVLEQKSKEYEHGTVVELTANPSEGYKFVEWQGDVTGTDNPVQITVDDPKEVTAVFEKKSYTLTVNTEGEGAVEEKIVQQKSKDYKYDTVVELTANPAEGWKFTKWKGANTSSDNPIKITVDNPKEVTAVFERKVYDLNVSIIGNGQLQDEFVEYRSKTAEYGSYLELTPIPDQYWEFTQWDGALSGDEVPEYILVDEPKDISVEFKRQWIEIINENGTDRPNSVIATSDNSLIVAGYTNSTSGFFSNRSFDDNVDIFIAKFDQQKNLLWLKIIGDSYNNSALDVIELSNGDYLIAGKTDSKTGEFGTYNGGANDLLLYRMDSNGNKIWSHLIGGDEEEYANQISEVEDGSLIVTGSTNSIDGDFNNTTTKDGAFMISLDPNGQIKSVTKYPEIFQVVFSQKNNTTYLVGRTENVDEYKENYDIPPDVTELTVTKSIDTSGNIIQDVPILWETSREYSDNLIESSSPASNGGLYLTGDSGAKPHTFLLVKLDSNLEIQWQVNGNIGDDIRGQDLIEYKNYLYLLATGGTNEQLFLRKYDLNGDLIWERVVGSQDNGHSQIDIKSDQIFISSLSRGQLSQNTLLAKLTLEGDFILLPNN